MYKKSNGMMYVKDYGLKAIGIIIFLMILFVIPYSEVISKFTDINKIGFIIALLLTMPILYLRSHRWSVIKHLQGVYYSSRKSFVIYLIGCLTSIGTTRHFGDNVKSKYLRKKGYSYGDSFITIVIDRIMDVFTLLFFLFIGLIILMKKIPLGWFYYVLVFFIFLMLVMIVLSGIIYRRYLRKVVYIIMHVFVPDRYRFAFQKNIEDFFKKAKKYSRKNYRNILVYSSVSWFLYFLQVYIFALALGFEVNIFFMIYAVAFSSLVEMLPISILGIGTRDLVFIVLMLGFGLGAVDGLALSFCVLLTLIFGAVLGGIAFFKKPIKF